MNNADDLLAQATCAVLIDGEIDATAWLFSDEGYLLTVGHVLSKDGESCDEVYDEVQVQFDDHQLRLAHKVECHYQEEEGIDFAVLKLADVPPHRQPLPISLAKSVELNSPLRLRGYGATFGDPTTGGGEFKAAVDRQSSARNRLFRYHTKELAEDGFSGGAVYSQKLGAVVAIQTEATRLMIGNMSGMVLAMPLYRIAEFWPQLKVLATIVLSKQKQTALETYFERNCKLILNSLPKRDHRLAKVNLDTLKDAFFANRLNLDTIRSTLTFFTEHHPSALRRVKTFLQEPTLQWLVRQGGQQMTQRYERLAFAAPATLPFCTNCGTQARKRTAKYCFHCGKKMR